MKPKRDRPSVLVMAAQQTELANAYKTIRELEQANRRLEAISNEHAAIIRGLQDYIKQQNRFIADMGSTGSQCSGWFSRRRG